jgi:hypothetical protein
MQQQVTKYFLPVILLFLMINTITLTGSSLFARWNADRFVVMGGNLILFAATIASFLIFSRSFQSKNPHVFGRSIYASFLIRFFSCAVAAAIYILVVKKEVNKPALIICMALYILYTFLEVRILTRLLKQRNNA